MLRQLETLDEDQLSRIYMEVFNNENGAIVLADLANRCFEHISTAPENVAIDPFTVVRNEGRRSVLKYIQTQLKPPVQPAEREQD